MNEFLSGRGLNVTGNSLNKNYEHLFGLLCLQLNVHLFHIDKAGKIIQLPVWRLKLAYNTKRINNTLNSKKSNHIFIFIKNREFISPTLFTFFSSVSSNPAGSGNFTETALLNVTGNSGIISINSEVSKSSLVSCGKFCLASWTFSGAIGFI